MENNTARTLECIELNEFGFGQAKSSEKLLTLNRLSYFNKGKMKQLPKLDNKKDVKGEVNIIETNKIEFFPSLKRISIADKNEKKK